MKRSANFSIPWLRASVTARAGICGSSAPRGGRVTAPKRHSSNCWVASKCWTKSARSAPKSAPNVPRKTARQWKTPMPKHRRRRTALLTRLRVKKRLRVETRTSSSPRSQNFDRILQDAKRGAIFGSLLHSRKLHPCHSPGEAGLAHLLEHFFHLSVLAEQVVDFLHAGAGAAGNALAAAAVDGFVMVALVSGHGIDDGLDAVDLLFVNLVGSLLQAGERADTGQHSDETLQ